MSIIGGSAWFSNGAGSWSKLVGGSVGPQVMEVGGEFVYYGYAYVQTSVVVGGGHDPIWTRVLRSQYARTVPPDIIARSISLSTRRGGIIDTTWVNDTSGYDIAFRMLCVEDPTYDLPEETLAAGTSSYSSTVGTAAGALGYHFRVSMQYIPDGDATFSGEIVGPTI